MDRKAIDTKVVRFSSSPSLKASPMKETHTVLFEIEGVHGEQVLSERHLLHRHGETGGVHRLLFHRSLHLRAGLTQSLVLDDYVDDFSNMGPRLGACHDSFDYRGDACRTEKDQQQHRDAESATKRCY